MPHDYLISARKRRGDQLVGEPGNLRFLKVARSAKAYGPAQAIASARDWAGEVQGLADGDENPFSISPRGDVLIFVHGYNNDIPTILDRQRALRTALRAEGWKGEVVAFDWPSENSTLNYLEDRADAAEVAGDLVTKGIRLLAQGQKEGCQTNVHVLGHSTGAYVIMEAFAQAEKRGDLFKSDWRIGQVALIAGDVSAASLSRTSEWARPMFKRVMRLTNYANPYDAVLGVSNAKRLGVSPRAGRVGLPEDADSKAVNVDCGPYFVGLKPQPSAGAWTHSWHFGNRVFARDLAMTLEGAIDRHAIPTRDPRGRDLVLVDRPRPPHMAEWEIKVSANGTPPGPAPG